MHPDLLNILRCPESRQTLSFASEETLSKINHLIQNGSCRNRSGSLITEDLQQALIREDGQWLYPVRNGIPVLLSDEAVRCAPL